MIALNEGGDYRAELRFAILWGGVMNEKRSPLPSLNVALLWQK